MKMQPIVYRTRYSNENYDSDVCMGFCSGQKDKHGRSIKERFVDIVPDSWMNGSCLVVTISEVVVDVTPLSAGTAVTQLEKRWIYDRPSNDENAIVPTTEQIDLIIALASNELRGKFAERIVNNLYIDLVVLNPKFALERWLPEVVAFHKSLYEKYGFKRKSN